MHGEKVLILDKDMDTAAILEEYINSFGHYKVFLTTNPDILDDMNREPSFQYLFIDVETVTPGNKSHKTRDLSAPPGAVVAVMHREYNEWTQELMQLFSTRIFFKKPFQIRQLSEILSRNGVEEEA